MLDKFNPSVPGGIGLSLPFSFLFLFISVIFVSSSTRLISTLESDNGKGEESRIVKTAPPS